MYLLSTEQILQTVIQTGYILINYNQLHLQKPINKTPVCFIEKVHLIPFFKCSNAKKEEFIIWNVAIKL